MREKVERIVKAIQDKLTSSKLKSVQYVTVSVLESILYATLLAFGREDYHIRGRVLRGREISTRVRSQMIYPELMH